MESEESKDPLEPGNREMRLGEILGWLLKMGFTVEDILKWATDTLTKRKMSQQRSIASNHETVDQSTNGNGTSTLGVFIIVQASCQKCLDTRLIVSGSAIITYLNYN